MNTKIGNVNSENNIIRMLMHDLSFFYDTSFNLTTEDFTLSRNRLLFLALANSAEKGIQTFSASDFIKEIKQYGVTYEALINQDLIRVLEDDSKYDNALFLEDVERVKKCTVLRDLSDAGFDISEYYSTDFPTLLVDLNSLDTETILRNFKEKLNTIEDKNMSIRKKTSGDAYEGLIDLMKKLEVEPDIGAFLDGDIYNYVVRGARFGKYYINSASSGAGKTRTMVGQACSLAFPYINSKGKIVVKNKYYPVLYIPTEQQIDEIQTMILSYVSGVPEDKILESRLNEEDKKRIEIAIEIIKLFKENFKIEEMLQPSLALLRTKAASYIYRYNIHYIFYDYIFTNVEVSKEFGAFNLREDVILMMMSNTLKEIAASHNVFVASGTQTNTKADEKFFRDESCIRGSRAIVDKGDIGVISGRIRDDELEIVTLVSECMELSMQPNLVSDVYKNRRGKLSMIKIFRHFDYSTCRVTDLFATDSRGELVTNYSILEKEVKEYEKVGDLDNVKLQED